MQSFRFVREDQVALLLNAISQAAYFSNPINLTHKMFASSVSILFRIALGYSFQGSDLDKGNFHCLLYNISTLLGEFIGWIIDRINDHHGKFEKSLS